MVFVFQFVTYISFSIFTRNTMRIVNGQFQYVDYVTIKVTLTLLLYIERPVVLIFNVLLFTF